MESSATQPLAGVRVIDFTQVMLGPSATQVLADYGADVIKIERPGTGDLSRSSIPDDPDGLDNPVFRSLNRNKRSIALDLRKVDGKAIIYDLVRGADVVVNNFRAGVMERMGFGYDELAKINPRIICAFGSGFGQRGPLSHKGGQDVLAQALSGVMRRKSNDDEPLTVYATALCDYTAGMHLVQAILLALLQREKTGRGQQVAVSLFESMLAMQMQEAVASKRATAPSYSWARSRRTRCRTFALRSACPIFPPTSVTRRSRDRSHTRSNCRRYSANASRRTLLNFGSPGSTSRTCSARRC
jgi:crotonobetainyl-CoA:carnitine CoA-transferase CaiB-like acyl-CoA transferase